MIGSASVGSIWRQRAHRLDAHAHLFAVAGVRAGLGDLGDYDRPRRDRRADASAELMRV